MLEFLKSKKIIIPNVEDMKCVLDRKFIQCDIHRCSTYGCLNCGQYKKK